MKYLLALSVLVIAFTADAQDDEPIADKIADLVLSWDLEADNLNDYAGLRNYCRNAEYRQEVQQLLHDLHHYDSILYKKLQKVARYSNDKEVKKTLQDIEKFETEYSMKEFIQFLRDECHALKDIEKNEEDLRDEIGEESYDSKIYLLETELLKYINHITKRVDVIGRHVQHLHIE